MDIVRNILLWGSENQWLRQRAPKFFFVRKAVKRFMPGEALADAIQAARGLQQEKIATVFTYLGENIDDMAEATQVTDHYLQVLRDIKSAGIDCEISLKLTQIGLDLSFEQSYENFQKIARAAELLGNFVWIDMESSKYTEMTLDFYERARGDFQNTGLCLQSYLYRTEEDFSRLLKVSPAIRLVKGAYHEPKEIAFPEKRKVDQNYLKLAERMLRECRETPVRAAFATHDMKLISQIQRGTRELQISGDRVEFQMLYGITPESQKRLVREGHKVRVLISYGESWFPWYMRRLAERPANLMFVIKNFFAR